MRSRTKVGHQDCRWFTTFCKRRVLYASNCVKWYESRFYTKSYYARLHTAGCVLALNSKIRAHKDRSWSPRLENFQFFGPAVGLILAIECIQRCMNFVSQICYSQYSVRNLALGSRTCQWIFLRGDNILGCFVVLVTEPHFHVFVMQLVDMDCILFDEKVLVDFPSWPHSEADAFQIF